MVSKAIQEASRSKQHIGNDSLTYLFLVPLYHSALSTVRLKSFALTLKTLHVTWRDLGNDVDGTTECFYPQS